MRLGTVPRETLLLSEMGEFQIGAHEKLADNLPAIRFIKRFPLNASFAVRSPGSAQPATKALLC
jgi:hypothetical protein